MLKVIGIGMVLLASMGIGFGWAAELKSRLIQIGYLEKALTFLISEISYENSSVPESFLKLGKRFPGNVGLAFNEMFQELTKKRGSSLEEIWIVKMTDLCRHINLKGYEGEEIIRIGGVLGLGDKELQITAINRGIQLIREMVSEDTKKLTNRQKISCSLGIVGGLMTIILLI